MLIFGTIEFGQMDVCGVNVRGATSDFAMVHSVDRKYPNYCNKELAMEENEGKDYVDTEVYQGAIFFSKDAYLNAQPSYGVDENSKEIHVSWTLGELQEFFKNDGLSDGVMWSLMQQEFHKYSGIDYESMKDRIYAHQHRRAHRPVKSA